MTAADIRLDVALVHSPVVNKNNERISSAVTNLDLHDIARAGRTFGVGTYWVVTPDVQQQELAAQITGHWTAGYGGTVNPDRANALSRIRICTDLEEAITGMRTRDGQQPRVVATSADQQAKSIAYTALQHEIWLGTPILLLFGTAWGLAPEVMEQVDHILPPILGPGVFNHLSVRSAASIVLDRLLGRREQNVVNE